MIDQPFRTITNRILLENLFKLIVRKNNTDHTYINTINKVLHHLLKNIKLLMCDNKFIKENAYEIFENEWKNYTQQISQTIESLVSKPFLLFPFNMDDSIEGKNYIYHRLPKNPPNSYNKYRLLQIIPNHIYVYL